MKKLYVFGNEFLEEDSLARGVSEHLSHNIELVHCRSPDDLLDVEDDCIVILDVVKGVDEPLIITDISQLKTRSMMSLHDFDVGFFLNLLKELGMAKKIKILGIPQQGDVAELVSWVGEHL